jgi:hypothetical protein
VTSAGAIEAVSKAGRFTVFAVDGLLLISIDLSH